MADGFKKPKIVIDPLLGLIDITDVLPLIDIASFQSLGFKYQLGFAYSIFPAATHTRKQHSLGAYERTRRLAEDWLKYGFINQMQARNLPIFALYHDIGHGPFSHITENLGSVTHDERGLQVFESLEEVVRKAGFDYEFIHGLFSRKDPMHLAVFDKNLGMEKLDYLDRDAFYTLGERPGVEFLAHHVHYIDNQVVVNESAVDQAKDIQEFYIKMYKHVYTRKKSAIIQRLIEKMTHYLMADGLTENELFALTDFGLLGKIEISSNKRVQLYYEQFKRGSFPKITLEFKHEAVVATGDSVKKLIKTVGMNPDVLEKILSSDKIKKAELLEKVESDIAKLTGIPEESVAVIPMEAWRFRPADIKIQAQNGDIIKVSDVYPGHFKALEEYGRSHLGLRIAVFEECRKDFYKQSDKVRDYLLEIVNSQPATNNL